MAQRKKKPTKTEQPTDEKALAVYDEELAEIAAGFAEQESGVVVGSFIRVSGGQLSYDETPFPNNEMAVVILDAVLENVYYSGGYDPDNPSAPDCYAFGRNNDEMAPHERVGNPQCELCADCDWNQYGTAERGKGKACRNKRRLALIPAGSFDRDGDYVQYEPGSLETKDVVYFGLPPTSIKTFAAYVKNLANGPAGLAPFQVVTRVFVRPDERTQFKVHFEEIGIIDKEEQRMLLQRHKAQRKETGFPYPDYVEEPEDRPAPRSRRQRSTRQKPTTTKKAGVEKAPAKKTRRKTTTRKRDLNDVNY